ncbi:MAG: YgiT-type zinc finger protein [Candidatus Sumerlaeota bacterium]|nr:YgiT-type zinc finger protein [Candidatus Sumerlaeota bacterium]
MKPKQGSICKACRKGSLRDQEVAQAFEREGIQVKIDGIPALVCDQCGEVYYPAGLTDKVIQAAEGLFSLGQYKHAGHFKSAIS